MIRQLRGWTGLFAAVCTVGATTPALADFYGQAAPISVKVMYCDYNPRIVVEFADSSLNVWYPANNGDASKEFLSAAMAAKISGQNFYFYGTDSTTSSYCLAISARQVSAVFGTN